MELAGRHRLVFLVVVDVQEIDSVGGEIEVAVVEDAVQAAVFGFAIGSHQVFLIARAALVDRPQNVSIVVAIELAIHIAAEEVGNLIN